MRLLLVVAAFLVIPGAGALLGALAWHHRERLVTAWRVLRGQIKIGADGIAHCEREHVEAGCVQVKKDAFEKLKKVASEHMVALGFIAAKDKKDFAKTIEQVMDGR